MDYAQVHKVFGPDVAGNGPERKYSPRQVQRLEKGGPDRHAQARARIHEPRREAQFDDSHANEAFIRLTNAHSKKTENHTYTIALFFMYYNYCRVHSTLKTNPAVKVGLSDHIRSIEELLGLLD